MTSHTIAPVRNTAAQCATCRHAVKRCLAGKARPAIVCLYYRAKKVSK